MKKTLNTLMLICGILAAILGASFGLGFRLFPVEIVKLIPIVIFVLLEIILILSILMMLTSKSGLAKLGALPVIVTLLMVTYLLTQMPIYELLMNATTNAQYEISSDEIFNTMRKGFLFFNIAIWVSVAPIFIGSIFLARSSSSKIPKNIDDYYPAKARVLSFTQSGVRINKVPVYNLELEIHHYDDIYTMNKSIMMNIHNLISIQVGDYIDVLIHPEKKDKVHLKLNEHVY